MCGERPCGGGILWDLQLNSTTNAIMRTQGSIRHQRLSIENGSVLKKRTGMRGTEAGT